MSSLESRSISTLRLPLCVAVVMIHCVQYSSDALAEAPLPDAKTDLPRWFLVAYRVFVNGLPSCAVPLFLFVAGYLFFRGGVPHCTSGARN